MPIGMLSWKHPSEAFEAWPLGNGPPTRGDGAMQRLSGVKYVVGHVVRAEIVVLAVVGALCLILGRCSADEITQAFWWPGESGMARANNDIV